MTSFLHTKEHADIISQFERDFPYIPKKKEEKELWAKGHIYTNGNANEIFKAYRAGYSLGKSV